MKEITATFKNGKQVTYTAQVLELLKTDREVKHITDAKTGEVIYKA